MGVKHQRVTFDVPKDLDDDQRAQLADDIIETIRRRTERGIDRTGSKFPKYSADYAESLDFKVAGKSKSQVNLTLSGDMLAALAVLDSKPGRITIGFEKGSDENARADGNIRGSYGGSPNSSKARDFLGIPPGELQRLLRFYT
jgi:hypothetical protein